MESKNSVKIKELVEHAKRITRKAKAENRILNMDDLAREVQQCRPLHFYVGYDRASMILHQIERSGARQISDETQEMWLDLHEQVRGIMERRPKLTFAQALTQALCFSRPKRFYIGTGTIKRHLSKHFCYVLTANDDVKGKKFC